MPETAETQTQPPKKGSLMPDTNAIRRVIREELKRDKEEDNVIPLERLSAGYAERDAAVLRADPQSRSEEQRIRRELNGGS